MVLLAPALLVALIFAFAVYLLFRPPATAFFRGTNARAIAAPVILPSPLDTATCVECRAVFNLDDLICHGGTFVCARCKPVFLQKLAEGAKDP
jgi:hypothetical protein